MKHLLMRLLSLLLVVTMLWGFAVPAGAVDGGSEALYFEKLEDSTIAAQFEAVEPEADAPLYADTDSVRVSIVLEKKSTLDKGYSTMGIAENPQAMAYRETLKQDQQTVTARIENAIGGTLDVQWNLTLAANIISANVHYGEIGQIAAVDGVQEVVLETRYEPAVYSVEENDPSMATSGEMIGTSAAWLNGYTGEGSRVAIIDTGIDTDHQSFSADAFLYALETAAADAGAETEVYLADLGLLDAAQIAAVLDQLNVADKYSAEDLYVNEKVPFAYNYIDGDVDVVHDNDSQGSHGSHVSGIAAANRYIRNGDGTYSDALKTALVQGVAPDAQIITMKVFGKAGGAYDSDYFAAIEDAIVLGCDSVNLSLGTAMPGFSYNEVYQELLDSLAQSDILMVTSAGNYGAWTDYLESGVQYLYADDVNLQTGGEPGTYTNTLSVASVENDGSTGRYFNVGGENIVYNQTLYNNVEFTTLAGTQEYVFIDGIGTTEEWEELADVLDGRIAVCSRGTTSFYQKAAGAVENGAIGVVIYNNTSGVINMDLTDYAYSEPVVSITQSQGAIMRELAQAVTDSEGNVRCYLGTLTVKMGMGSSSYHSEYYTMSEFSSWGVTGNLTLKPEITAPGGYIYSVNGVDKSGTAYETMSGTSMSAPQISGMAALVAQRIREEELEAQTGCSPRQLIQSLLMSTAVPLREEASGGNYWSVLKQGSGLANVDAALSAGSYILMNADATDSWADGRVKAELGDDPDRNGAYSFSFTINNFGSSDQRYTLSADIFTQDVFAYDGELYLDTWTTMLGAKVTYTVDGEIFVPVAQVDCDLDGDGDTDADDAQIVLNYAAGLIADIDAISDVDGDGETDTYDAYLILDSMETRAVTVPAGGKAEVRVEIRFPEALKQFLDESYEDGAYVEGYVYVEPVSTEEGVFTDVTHSIPVLGFYGSWTDPSMYDQGTYMEHQYGVESEPYMGNAETNGLTIRYDGDNTRYWQTVNPYMVEETYRPERAAVSLDTTLVQYRSTMIRNAAATACVITDQDGEILYLSNPTGETSGAWYYLSGGSWQNTISSTSVNRKVSALGVSDGDTIHVSLVAVPEYYADADGITREEMEELITSGSLGDGAFLTTTLTVDSQAPVLDAVEKDPETGVLTVSAQDDQYIAAIQVTTKSGTKTYASVLPEQTEKNQKVTVELDVADAGIGKECLIRVGDYAGNVSTYLVRYDGVTEDYSGRMFGFTDMALLGITYKYYWDAGYRWMEIDPDTAAFVYETKWTSIYQAEQTGVTQVGTSANYISAAEYVQGWVYMACSDGYFYVAEHGQWDGATKAGRWDKVTSGIVDLSYNYADGKLYALAEAVDGVNEIYTVDLQSGDMELAFTLTVQLPEGKSGNLALGNLAIDSNGNFWAMNDENGNYDGLYGYMTSSYLYTWSAGDITDGTVTVTPVNNTSGGYVGGYWVGSLAWDHDAGVLYMAATNSGEGAGTSNYNRICVVDTTTGKASAANSTLSSSYAAVLGTNYTGLYIVPSNVEDTIGVQTQATGVDLSMTELTVLEHTTAKLEAYVYPWTMEDRGVTWSSSDEDVAVVDKNGNVTTTGTGTAVITATTNAEPHLTASCTVHSEPMISAEVTGLVCGSELVWGDIDTADLSGWQTVEESRQAYIGGALVNGKIYAHDGSNMYTIDPDTHEATSNSAIVTMWQWSDAASCAEIFPDYPLFALCNGGTFVGLIAPESGTLMYMDLSGDFGEDPMAAIAEADCVDVGGEKTVHYYVMTESGDLYHMGTTESSLYYGESDYSMGNLGNTGISLGGAANVTSGCHASMIYDEATGYLILSTNANSGEEEIFLIDPETLYVSNAGNLDRSVSAVTTLYQYDRITELTVRASQESKSLFAGESAQLSARVLPKSYTQGVTWSSSDPTVVSVDENGVITALREGTATVTATSVDVNDAGQTACDQVEVTVLALTEKEITFKAQVNTANGSCWATINTADLSTYTSFADAQTAFTGAGPQYHMIFASDGNYSSTGYIYAVDPSCGLEERGSACGSSWAFLDGAAAPITGSWNNFTFLANCQYLVSLENWVTGDISGFPLYQYGYTDLGALAYAGRNEDGKLVYYALGTDGTLHIFAINDTSLSMRMDTVGNVGYTFENFQTLSMTYIDDGTNLGLVVADSSKQGNLYWIDLSTGKPTIGKLGTLAGAQSIVGLYTDWEISANLQSTDADVLDGFTPGTGTDFSSPISLTTTLEPIQAEQANLSDPIVNGAGGSTNVAGTLVTRTRPSVEACGTGAEATDDAVTLTVTESVDVTNGLITISYDPQVLTYTGTASAIANTAVNEESGTITFAYATAAGVSSGDAIATLTFGYKQELVDTTITLTTLERNGDHLASESIQVEVEHEVGGHDYQVTESQDATCTADGYRVWTCGRCGDSYTEVVTAAGHSYGEWVVTKEPTCTEQGEQVRTCGVCGHTEAAVLDVTACPSEAYSDLSGDAWYHESIDFILSSGLMKGISDTIFAPDAHLTRAQLVVILYRMEGSPDTEELENPFTDVGEGAWFTDAVVWAASAGVVKGVTETTFAPDEDITREQMATLLYRYSGAEPVDGDYLKGFTDAGQIGAYAVDAMNWAVAQGLIRGVTDTTIAPLDTATRAQIATILQRYCGQ